MRRAACALVATLAISVASACGGGGAGPAQDKALCDVLVTDLAGSGLAGTPTQDQAKTTGNRLDPRVVQVASPSLHEAVVALHSHLHRVESARKKNDSGAADKAAASARGDVHKIATKCGRPDSDYLGT